VEGSIFSAAPLLSLGEGAVRRKKCWWQEATLFDKEVAMR